MNAYCLGGGWDGMQNLEKQLQVILLELRTSNAKSTVQSPMVFLDYLCLLVLTYKHAIELDGAPPFGGHHLLVTQGGNFC